MLSDFNQHYDTLTTDNADFSYDLVAEEERKKFVCKHPGCGKIFRYNLKLNVISQLIPNQDPLCANTTTVSRLSREVTLLRTTFVVPTPRKLLLPALSLIVE